MTSPSPNIVPFPRRKRAPVAHEIAFLPAALEIVETPPSPIGRAIGATIIGAFCFALIWASLGSVDIIATANGRIVPSGRSKIIQPFETGVVSAIHVRDGQKVQAGDVLIELDPTMTSAERERFRNDLVAAELDVARLRATLSWQDNRAAEPRKLLTPPAGASAVQIETQRQFLAAQTSEQKARLAEIEHQFAQRQAERATVAAGAAKLEATIPVLQERVDLRKTLYDKQLGTRLVYLTEFQELVTMKQDLTLQKSRLQEADAALAALHETLERTAAEYKRGVIADLAAAELRVAALSQDMVKAERRTRLQRLTAPVEGVVQQLAVHTVGGVVTPAQPLAVVVPENSDLEIEAVLANQDVGFVHPGQEVSVKVAAFNFTRYGLLPGKVSNVSRDAVTPAGPTRSTEDGGSTAPEAKEDASYVARVSLDRNGMQVDDNWETLTPGMTVTVEIKTGSRRIIGYLLSPLEKQRQESMRER
ncbi:HlyD family type I secretion periplasmic adaptor subunit [Methylocystis parvus]|uniref:Membrane fusion protein (MFP) family protein n=1 Tax=Methylocystis parvus TaxID=134 RepID=A0A6B8M255_9HYPH|nr:HlyD family type I secretion periplasmic adaptor subunit [Methylocystis parvus]QGM96405.1 HlyD family type I secretion periplasmic adaptor subunit [Methylocystis parvus]WBJ99752.1 HlyD family type I secretion periplasmic adaptor subunit [Methylocystis parvus OBBP]